MAKFRGAVKACGECGKEFRVSPSRASTALYCSNECAYKHRSVGRRKRVLLTCQSCGTQFESVACHASRRKYCSKACKNGDEAYKAVISNATFGAKNGAWKGGRILRQDGYIYVRAPHHPFTSNGYVFEHRLVMEEWLRVNDPDSKFLIKLGDRSYLSPDFHVHHRDEDKANNEIANLVCMTPDEHKRHHGGKEST